MGDLDKEHYTERHIKNLRKQLGSLPLSQNVGRAICPHCKHLEARWRSESSRESPPSAIVRIRCSQCQLSAVIRAHDL
jgi:RNase P subunit RPR2